MNQSSIEKDYQKFAIPKEAIPAYGDSNSFALGFKKFTLLQDVFTVYSDTSVASTCYDAMKLRQ